MFGYFLFTSRLYCCCFSSFLFSFSCGVFFANINYCRIETNQFHPREKKIREKHCEGSKQEKKTKGATTKEKVRNTEAEFLFPTRFSNSSNTATFFFFQYIFFLFSS